MEGLDKLFKKS